MACHVQHCQEFAACYKGVCLNGHPHRTGRTEILTVGTLSLTVTVGNSHLANNKLSAACSPYVTSNAGAELCAAMLELHTESIGRMKQSSLHMHTLD
jgi:hypothetical protein